MVSVARCCTLDEDGRPPPALPVGENCARDSGIWGTHMAHTYMASGVLDVVVPRKRSIPVPAAAKLWYQQYSCTADDRDVGAELEGTLGTLNNSGGGTVDMSGGSWLLRCTSRCDDMTPPATSNPRGKVWDSPCQA